MSASNEESAALAAQALERLRLGTFMASDDGRGALGDLALELATTELAAAQVLATLSVAAALRQ